MGVPSAEDLEAKREEIVKQLTAYREQLSDAFNQVEAALMRGEYAYACSLMSEISASQGQTSVKMRATLVRHGFIVRERDNV